MAAGSEGRRGRATRARGTEADVTLYLDRLLGEFADILDAADAAGTPAAHQAARRIRRVNAGMLLGLPAGYGMRMVKDLARAAYGLEEQLAALPRRA